MNWQQDLKNYGLFLLIGVPLLLPMIFAWGFVTEVAGFVAMVMLPVYFAVSVYRWAKDKVRA